MLQLLQKSLLLLFFTIVICCGIYPISLWIIGQTFFPFQANGSIVVDETANPIGSLLIAQPFTKEEYFQPRPSAASYDASASSSSALAASNYALRNRVANAIGTIVTYQQSGKAVGPDIEKWFQQRPNVVAEWATAHPLLAAAWVNADHSHAAYVDRWSKSHPNEVRQFIHDHPALTNPTATDLASAFFQHFSQEFPGKFPSLSNGKPNSVIAPVSTGADIQSLFFDMWRQDHPSVELQELPADMVMTSASGLDPHISLHNARFQLERVATKWATNLKRPVEEMKNEINHLLNERATAPLAGLAGEKFINVLEINLELRRRYGIPKA